MTSPVWPVTFGTANGPAAQVAVGLASLTDPDAGVAATAGTTTAVPAARAAAPTRATLRDSRRRVSDGNRPGLTSLTGRASFGPRSRALLHQRPGDRLVMGRADRVERPEMSGLAVTCATGMPYRT